MTLAPSLKSAVVSVPETVDIPAIVAAAGGDLSRARYVANVNAPGTGTLTVPGVSQEALEAAAEGADPLYAQRVVLKSGAQQEFRSRLAAGMPWVGGKVIDIDEERSIGRLVAGVVRAMLPGFPTIPWRTADNTPLMVDADGMKAMGVAAFDYFVALNVAYHTISDAIAAAPNAEALSAIDPTAGWPSPPTPPSA